MRRFIFISSFLCALLSLNGLAGWTSFDHKGSNVFVFIPTGLSESSPLMINLHGCAQKAQVLVDHGNWEEAAQLFKTIVVIPEVPGGGVIAGCWDYYGLNHDRGNRHNSFIFSLLEQIKTKYSIDENQIFVSGLSSGGGESFVLGCLAPEVFAGIGLNAAPSVGTSSFEISRATISVEQIISNCEKLAGSKKAYLKTQLISLIYGDNDFLVDRKYSSQNAKAFSSLMGALDQKSFDTSSLRGSQTKGRGTLYALSSDKKPAISIIENSGLGHNWPAGQGGSSRSFVNKDSINYPYYILQFFTSNRRR